MRTRRTIFTAGLSLLGGCVGGIGSTETPTDTPTPEPATRQEMREATTFRLRVSDSVVTGEAIDVNMEFVAPPERYMTGSNPLMQVTVKYYFEDEYRGIDTATVSPGQSKSKHTSFEANIAEPGEYEFTVEFEATFTRFDIIMERSETFTVNS